MSYKIISKVVTKEELKQNRFIKEEFILKRECNNINLIHGVIINENNEKLKDCAVLLQSRVKCQEEYEDLSVVYTNEEGVFGFCVKIESNKEYRVLIFAPNKIK